MNTAILAHQGGWDEFLMVAGPLLFLSLVVWLAARRFKPAESESLPADRNAEDHNAEDYYAEDYNHEDDIEETLSNARGNNPRDPIEEPVP